MTDDEAPEQADATMGDVPIVVTRRVSEGASRGVLDDFRKARRRHELLAAETARPTGTELAQTKNRADAAMAQIGEVKTLADKAAKDASLARQQAESAVQTVGSIEDQVSGHERRISALEQSGLACGPVLTRLLETETDGWGVAGAATVASVTVPVVAGYSPSVVSVSVSGAAARRGAGRLRASVVCAGSTARIRTSAVPVGDGRAYPGVSATECVIGMSGHLRVPAGERVDLSLVASGSAWPASPSNWVRLTARVDYVRSVL